MISPYRYPPTGIVTLILATSCGPLTPPLAGGRAPARLPPRADQHSYFAPYIRTPYAHFIHVGIPLTTPTKQEAAMEQESEEGMEDVRTKTTMNMDPMAVKEKGEMTLYATNKKAVVFPLAYPPIILRVKFSVKPVTSFMTKDIIRARISKTLHHDFSPKTCNDVSTQDLKKYMDWLCSLRLILMISLHYFPP